MLQSVPAQNEIIPAEPTRLDQNPAVVYLADWLTVRGRNPGPLFVGVGNRNQGGRLTTQAIYTMVQTRGKEAQISAVSPHDFRRTFVGELLDARADMSRFRSLSVTRLRRRRPGMTGAASGQAQGCCTVKRSLFPANTGG